MVALMVPDFPDVRLVLTDDGVLASARPVLDAVGKTIVHVCPTIWRA